MATPAEVLLENSTLDSGTPWEHLNAPEGAGETIYITGAVEVNVEDVKIDVTVETVIEASVEVSDQLEATVTDVVISNVTEEKVEAGVCK